MQRVGQFAGIAGKPRMMPEASYPLGVVEASLETCLPGFVSTALREALPCSIATCMALPMPERYSRESRRVAPRPVRVVRDSHTLMSTHVQGVYPCGEGAGYAGGIMSAALDGIRVAQAILEG